MNTDSGERSEVNAAAVAGFDLHHLSEQQLAALGMAQIAYVKPIMVNGVQGFSIHAADGTQMGVAGDRNVAMAAVVQHEMLPLSVH